MTNEKVRLRAVSLTSLHPSDLESRGRALASAVGERAVKSIGTAAWLDWREQMSETGAHPKKRYLAAFLRGWAVPIGGWLPDGMADYLADRLDPKVPEPKNQGGRLPRRESERSRAQHAERLTGIYIASEVLRHWDENKRSGTSYPQDEAIRSVAEQMRLDEAEIKLAFSAYRREAG